MPLDLKAPVLALPRTAKRGIAILADIALCVFAVWFAYFLRLGEFTSMSGNLLIAAVTSPALAIPLFVGFGLYRAIFRYSGWPAMLAVARATGIYGLLFASIFTAVGFDDVPRTIGIIQPILLLLLIALSRALARLWLGDEYRSRVRRAAKQQVLIYGAGQAGRQLAAAMAKSPEMHVVGFLDDNQQLHGSNLNGLRVYDPADLDTLVVSLKVSDVLLAVPSLSRRRRNEILTDIRRAHVSVRTLPSMTDLAQGRVNISDLRELDVDDLLGRDPVPPDPTLLARSIEGKVVLVTGAGGSIGSELCRQILEARPARLLLVELSEFALYAIHQELSEKLSGQQSLLIPLIASVQDASRMRDIMSTWNPDTVYHAAAYKHVPLVEHNPVEGIRNNTLGTLCAAQAAMHSGVTSFVLISTDKAVRPTNVMGASKRLAEMVLQAFASNGSSTRFSMVRFGNVLDSSGSVVPRFRQQIRDGGPISLTHPEVTRYFMTIPEASQLVLQAGSMARGGEVFVLDMGQPVKVIDLARRMIALSGLTVRDEGNPEGDIAIEVTGLRPGEKLFEELLIGDDPEPTEHPRILRAREAFLSWEDLSGHLDDLKRFLDASDLPQTRALLQNLVAGYMPDEQIVDWKYLEIRKH
ncbi:MAG: polysaccharide biosynthesis protein [Betaproteobacteria bacterium]|nr:polysaccharide biosynthesis protein [Betaproteobacteria bacterium]